MPGGQREGSWNGGVWEGKGRGGWGEVVREERRGGWGAVRKGREGEGGGRL